MKELVFSRLLDPLAESNPDRPVFIDDDRRITAIGPHLARVRRIGAAIRHDLGVGKGQRFAVLALNSTDYIALWHVAFLGDAVIVPLNHRLSEQELRFILQDAEVAVLFVDAAHREIGARLAAACPSLREVILMGAGDGLTLDQLSDDGTEEWIDLAEDDPVLIMYTGGTTGLAKGVVHSQRSLVLNAYRQIFILDLLSGPSVYHLAAPLFHIAAAAGAVTAPAANAMVVVTRAFDAETFMAQVAEHRVTHATLVVTMLARILDHPGFEPEKLGSLRSISYGGSAMPSALIERLRGHFPKIQLLNGYGMTEAGLVTALDGHDHRTGNRLTSVGRPLIGTEVTIRDDTGNAVPIGTVGEICVRTGSLMIGYHNRREQTAEALRDGWYWTGDVGFKDEEGYVFLADRRSDMIISGGENIYSSEVENVVASHPAVQQVAVIGRPDETWGETVHAVVVLVPGKSATEAEIIAHARASLAKYKCPRSVEFRNEPLPISAAGKILKRELRRSTEQP